MRAGSNLLLTDHRRAISMPSLPTRSLLIAAAVALAPLALAAPPPSAPAAPPMGAMHMGAMHHGEGQRGGHWRGDEHSMRMLDQLDLSTSQRDNIRKWMQQERADARPEQAALMQKRTAFADATPGTSQYNTATSELVKAESQAAEARVTRQAALRAKIYAELTPAQRTKLAGLHQARQQKMQQWRKSHPMMQHATPPAASSAPVH